MRPTEATEFTHHRGHYKVGWVGMDRTGMRPWRGQARLWCGQLAAACHGLDVEGSRLLGPGKTLEQAT